MGFFKNLFKLKPENRQNEDDTDDENLTREQKAEWDRLQKEGMDNCWGDLITFYDYENYKELRNFGKFAVYEKCLIFHDKYSGKLMVPRDSFRSNKFASDVCRIEVSEDKRTANEFVVIDLFTDTNVYSEYDEVNYTPHNIFIKRSVVDSNKQIGIKISKLMYWYYGIKAENPDNLADYNEFIASINSYRESGYELFSYPIDINSMDAATYLWQLEKIVVLGRNTTTKDFLIYKAVSGMSDFRNKKDKRYILNRVYLMEPRVLPYDIFKSYSVSGTRDTYVNYNANDSAAVKSSFSPARAAVGYALAGPVGALAIGFKKQKLPLGSYTISVSDYRSINVKTENESFAFLPYELYGTMQKLYPEKEQVVFKQL